MRILTFLLLCGSLGLLACQPHPEAQADVILITERGEIGIRLFDDAPIHKENFLKLAQAGFYDSLAFHRVIDGFMVQTGDPRTRVTYPPTDTTAPDGPGYTLPPEFSDARFHRRGTVGAARWGDELNPEQRSSGSQFYIVTGSPARDTRLDSIEEAYTGVLRGRLYQAFIADSSFEGSFEAYQQAHDFTPFHYPRSVREMYRQEGGAPWLDFTYTIFGEVVSGWHVVKEIEKLATDPYDRPRRPVRVLHTRIPAAS